MEILIYGVWGFGLAAIGSFIGVCYTRIPIGKQIINGPSQCDNCGKKLQAYEMIPIISYLMLGGKCHSCKKRIPRSCLILELATVVVGMVPLCLFGLTINGFAVSMAACILLEIAIIDYKTMEISDKASLLLGSIGIVLMFTRGTYLSSLIGFCSKSTFLCISTAEVDGDGRCCVDGCGRNLLGFPNIFCAAFFGIVIGSIGAVIQKITKLKGWKSEIAFGPYLCSGIYIAMLFGEDIISQYLSMIQ